jgi:hypothetical protein
LKDGGVEMDRERREESVEVQFLTIEEASCFLNLKVSKLRRDVFMKVIPYYKVNPSVT